MHQAPAETLRRSEASTRTGGALRRAAGVLSLALALFAGCSSPATRIDEDWLDALTSGQRAAVQTAQDQVDAQVASRDRCKEALGRAAREVRLARASLATARAASKEAKLALALAEEDVEQHGGQSLTRAHRTVDHAEATEDAAEAKLELARVVERGARMDLRYTEAEIDLAKARVKLAQAEGVHELGLPEARELRLEPFDERVRTLSRRVDAAREAADELRAERERAEAAEQAARERAGALAR